MKTVFLRVLGVGDKAAALRMAIHEPEGARGEQRFEVDTASLASVPCSPFAYWATKDVLSCFRSLPPVEAEGRHAAAGASTKDNMRFVRAAWEVSAAAVSAPGKMILLGNSWVPLAKGGTHGGFYSNVHLVVNWAHDGRELKVTAGAWRAAKGWGDHWRAELHNSEYYGRPGATWPVRSQKGFSVRALGIGAIFGHKGPTTFVPEDDPTDLACALSLMNSMVFSHLVSLQMAFGAYEVGVIQRTPLPRLGPQDRTELASLARRAWSLKRRLDTRTEISHAFTLPALLQVSGDTLTARATAWAEHVHIIESELAAIQAEIDERCFDLYGIDEADRRAITKGFSGTPVSAGTAESESDADTGSESEADDEDEGQSTADTTSLAAELVSWAVGVAFGRFDVHLATGARALSPEPEPFDPLPVCSPAMLTGEDGLPLTSAPPGYPLTFPENGILVDDSGHPHDLTTAVRAVFDVVFGTRADAIWQEATALLTPKDHALRTWLSSSFFEHLVFPRIYGHI